MLIDEIRTVYPCKFLVEVVVTVDRSEVKCTTFIELHA